MKMLSLLVIHLNSPKQSYTVDGKHNGSESKICEKNKKDQNDGGVLSLKSASQEGPEGVGCQNCSQNYRMLLRLKKYAQGNEIKWRIIVEKQVFLLFKFFISEKL